MLKRIKYVNEETKQVLTMSKSSTESWAVQNGYSADLYDCEQAYNGEWYITGYAPVEPTPTDEEQKQARSNEYVAEVDPIQSHIDRLKDGDYTEEVMEEIAALRIQRDEKRAEIQARYPYSEAE